MRRSLVAVTIAALAFPLLAACGSSGGDAASDAAGSSAFADATNTPANTPDATTTFNLAIANVNEVLPAVTISEVAPWGSGNTTYAADWFEVTNTGTTDIDITGWKIDDNSNAFVSAAALRGLSILPAGKSAIFLEGTATGTTDATIIANFSMAWFGSPTLPSNVLIGIYGGSGVGLSTAGDAVNLFDATGDRVAGVSFGPSTTGITFDNTAGLNSTTLPLPVISTLSVVGVNGAYSTPQGKGSPGNINRAPSAVGLSNPVNTLAENTSTTTGIKVADVVITDDGLGTNGLSLSGTDASDFELIGNALYLKASTALNYEAKTSYGVTVNVDDATVGGTPDASINFALSITDVNDLATISGIATGSVIEDANVINNKLIATGLLTISDEDAGQNQFNTSVTSAPGNLGSLTITDTGAYTYSVDNSVVQHLGAGATKTETFTIQSLDGTASQSITITLNGVNDTPVAATDFFLATQGTPLTITVATLLGNDSDVDSGDVLSINGVSGSVGGTVGLNNNGTPINTADDFIIFTPTGNGSGGFTYNLSDRNGGTTLGTVNLLIGTRQLGGNGPDTLTGNNGPDYLDGGNGADNLFGGLGNDTLLGGNSQDLLVGGGGADLLTGGIGEDVFRFTSLSDSLLSGFDRITDLKIGVDRIDGPTAVKAANIAKLGAVASLTQVDISAVLTSSKFGASRAATFSVGSQTFLALNDGTVGFQSSSDAVIEITGFTGNLNNLSII